MVFKVQAQLANPGDDIYYSQGFRDQVEAHLNLLRFTNPARHHVEPDNVYQFEGNLFGYLASKGIPHDRHWIIMRMNEYHNPNEFGREPLEAASPIEGITLLFPDEELMSRLRSLYLSRQS